MTYRLSVVVMALLLVVGSVIAQNADEMAQIVQWASTAEATSQFTDSSFSADKALGEPDVFACEDNVNAWASADATGEEALAVGFEVAVVPTQVNIYQTYNPGSITGIDIIPADGSDPISVHNSADPGTDCPGVFSINLPGGLPESDGVIIHLDQSIIGDWNEIDAVELVGLIEGNPAKSMKSSIESGEFTDDYPVTSNDGSSTTEGDTAANDYGDEWGREITCDSGEVIENGIELTIIQQRGGSTYRVTVVGLDDFDPVLAVTDDFGNVLCNDDDTTAATYSANLPTTGQVDRSSTSAQVIFTNTSSGMADITLIVGGLAGTGGEFVVIVEGMVATSADGAGDPFSLYVSPALLESGVTPTAYNIAVTDAFDAMIFLLDENYNYIQDADGSYVACDDAGAVDLCWGDSSNLARSYVSRSQERQLPGGNLDAMLSIPLEDQWGGYINYAMTGNDSFGDYVAAFHLGTAQKP